MAVSLTRFSLWLWSGKEKESVDSVKFRTKNLSKKKWQSREERSLDKIYGGDAVKVASDGEIESEGPDWSIGWVEPHGIGFRSDDQETDDDGFAVLVPCYKSRCNKLVKNNSNNMYASAIKNLPNELSSEGKNCMEWLSSLQNF